MKSHCSVFIATSLDGFIARTDGALDWLEEANRLIPPGEDCGYNAFMESVDALVMGRNTFEKVCSFDAWPYPGKRVVVMSHRAVTIPPELVDSVSATSATPAQLVAQLAAEGAYRLYIDGGITIQSFLRASLIDELIITLIPQLLGSGRPLFGSLEHDIRLQLISSHSYPFGFVQNRYRVPGNE